MNIASHAESLCYYMKKLYRDFDTTMSGGNLSERDNHGNIWITPSGIDKGSLREEDIIKIDLNGDMSCPKNHTSSLETPIHLKLLRNNPEYNAVLHVHAPVLVGFSAMRLIPDMALIEIAHRKLNGRILISDYGNPGTEDLAEKVADGFHPPVAVSILENHGVFICAKTMQAAYDYFYVLNRVACIQCNASYLSASTSKCSDRLIDRTYYDQADLQWDQRAESVAAKLCQYTKRIQARNIAHSTEFCSYSAKVDDHRFIISPLCKSIEQLTAQDFVLVELDGKQEAGKELSELVDLHRSIYQGREFVRSIVTAVPEYFMAYGVVENTMFDARVIPEAYNLIQDCRRVIADKDLDQNVVDMIDELHSTVIVQNGFALFTAQTVEKAYDKLEVAESTAEGIVRTSLLGHKTISMNKETIDRFNAIVINRMKAALLKDV